MCCFQKNYFKSLNDKITSKLSLDDDSTLEVMSVDKIKIKIIDGAVRILEDVIYVPKMQNNLFSNSSRFSGLWLQRWSSKITLTLYSLNERKIILRVVLFGRKYNKDINRLKTNYRGWYGKKMNSNIHGFYDANVYEEKNISGDKTVKWRSLESSIITNSIPTILDVLTGLLESGGWIINGFDQWLE